MTILVTMRSEIVMMMTMTIDVDVKDDDGRLWHLFQITKNVFPYYLYLLLNLLYSGTVPLQIDCQHLNTL